MVEPIVNPAALENTSSVSANKLILSHVGSSSHCCSINGTKSVTTLRVTIGTAICQATSGARRVFGCGSPQNTNLNTRVRFKLVKPLTTSNTPTTQGLTVQKPSAHCSIAQKLPNGKRVTIPADPTTKAVVVAGILDHKPPISVKSWVVVV